MRDKIEAYLGGMEEQREELVRQLAMLDGAEQLARQLLADLDAEAQAEDEEE